MSEEKRDREYWKKRFEELERAQHEQGRVCYEDIEKMYRRAQNELEKEISKWYGRFARNNMVSMTDARKMLTGRELEELRWDVSEYIAHGEENAVSGAWIKQLENASARYHVSRLEALKLQTQQQLEVLFGNQLDRIDTAMKDIYTSGYYKTAFELQKGIGVGWNFATLDDKTISKVINKPWAVDGRNFSERIWKSKEKLINEMHKTLTQNIILGQDPQKAINTIAERMKVSKVNAGRLVMTEEAFFSSAAQKECFAELDVEEFEVVATLDSHTSQLCRDMDGKHFPISQYEIGVTAPPFHVNCRSTTCPYFDDEFSNLGKRAARGEDGKTYFVPANMTYREWEKQFVSGNKSELNKDKANDIINNESKVLEHMTLDVPDDVARYSRKQIIQEMKSSPTGQTTIEHIINSNVRINLINSLQRHTNRGDQLGNTVRIFLSNTKNERVVAQTIIHEMTHYYYNIGGCQHAEAVCFAMEKMHIAGRDYLTKEEWDKMVKLAVDNYPEYEWEAGGYGDFTKFDFVRE